MAFADQLLAGVNQLVAAAMFERYCHQAAEWLACCLFGCFGGRLREKELPLNRQELSGWQLDYC